MGPPGEVVLKRNKGALHVLSSQLWDNEAESVLQDPLQSKYRFAHCTSDKAVWRSPVPYRCLRFRPQCHCFASLVTAKPSSLNKAPNTKANTQLGERRERSTAAALSPSAPAIKARVGMLAKAVLCSLCRLHPAQLCSHARHAGILQLSGDAQVPGLGWHCPSALCSGMQPMSPLPTPAVHSIRGEAEP